MRCSTTNQRGMQPPVPIRQVDTNGHGTHVAGIAASSGLATSPAFPLVVMSASRPNRPCASSKTTRDEVTFDDVDILLGVRFCLDRAEGKQAAVVVNLSLGGPGVYDGSSLMEVALDELFADRPGRVLVTASGTRATTASTQGVLLFCSPRVTLKVTRVDVAKELRCWSCMTPVPARSAAQRKRPLTCARQVVAASRSPWGRAKATFEGKALRS